MVNNTDYFNELFGQYTGDKKYDKFGYHCTGCGYELEQIIANKPLGGTKKLFYCKRSDCPKFGVVTVVARKKVK